VDRWISGYVPEAFHKELSTRTNNPVILHTVSGGTIFYTTPYIFAPEVVPQYILEIETGNSRVIFGCPPQTVSKYA
jgi:hypothetical protein